MEYLEVRPRPPLSRWVRCFWFLRDEPCAAPGAAEDVFPDGCSEIVLNLADPFVHHGSGETRVQASRIVVGTITGPMRIGPTGRVDVVGIRLEPHAASAVLRVPCDELTDRTLPLDDLLPRGDWDARLHEEADVEARARLLEKRMLERIDARWTDPLVEMASGIIADTRGAVTVDDLSRRLGVGHRRLERRFRARVGLAPKTLCRITRFQSVLNELQRREARLAGVAARCGYHDQAHLTHDFRELAGRTPGSFLRSPDLLPRLFAGLAGTPS